MQMVKRIVGGFFLTILLLWVFAPKQELYYLLEKELKKSDIVISNETITDTWFGLKLSNADIYVKGIKMANTAKLQFNFFFFYNTLMIEDIKIDESLHNMAPKAINSLSASYSIVDPIKINLKGEGSFGIMNGAVTLLDRKINILFPVPKEINTFKKFLKKDKTKGWYYETTY